MKNMDIAAERLIRAVAQKERILIFGDYDVDGTTGVALLFTFLKNYCDNLLYYVPNRYTEGYGVSEGGIEFAILNNVSLIITVDCGIKGERPIARAKDANIDVIVCDHHEPGKVLPAAIAILDAKQTDCNYPYKELSGCGVVFKLLQAFCMKKELDLNLNLFYLLDFVVVSIASDIVPITGENRVLAYYGLQVLNTMASIGLQSMKKITELIDREIQIVDIVFKIAPRINAAGRMDSGSKAVELLICEHEKQADEFCVEIEHFNTSRKNLDEQITNEALQMISDDNILKTAMSTVVYNEKWSKGVIGIVASRLIETYHRPTIVFTRSGDKITGSARSVPGFNLYNAIESCGDLLENYGGHFYAAGLSLKLENLNEFKIRFEDYVKNNISAESIIPTINIDAELNLNDITPKFYRVLKQLAPFGPQNMTPVFVSTNCSDSGYGKTVGKNNEHLKLQLIQNDNKNLTFEAIAFGFGDIFNNIKNPHKFSLVYTIVENEFMNQTTLQLMVKDIKF
jgi:single-stranded-DNA-specific exonuclease